MTFRLDDDAFTTAQTAKAAGVSARTLGNQLTRGSITLSNSNVQQPGAGRHRLFSLRRVLHIALAQELARCGFPIEQASTLAFAFTDIGGSDTDVATIVGTPTIDPRLAGELHAEGGTVLRVFMLPNGPRAAVGSNYSGDPAFHYDGRLCRCVLAVDLESLVRDTRAALGLS